MTTIDKQSLIEGLVYLHKTADHMYVYDHTAIGYQLAIRDVINLVGGEGTYDMLRLKNREGFDEMLAAIQTIR